MRYDVQLSWPRASRQPIYMDTIEAQTKAEALLIAEGRAKQEGWSGRPLRQQVTIAREDSECAI